MAKLSELKRLLAQGAARPAAKNRPAAKPSDTKSTEHDAGEIDLRQTFADVTPLRGRNRALMERKRPTSVASQRAADDARALAESRYGVEPSPLSWEPGQEHDVHQTFLRKGLGTDVLARLRRGQWSVQGELDLHRHTRDEARDALTEFLNEARSAGWRCVRIVHGKGLSSPNREPVLKGKVRQWLAQRDEVLAYCEAPHHSGGSGAVLVLLKGRNAG